MYGKSRYCIGNNGSWLRIQFCRSGLDKITQSVVDSGYSENQPLGNMWNDKDYKSNRQHLERFGSCPDAEHESDNSKQEHQPCKQMEYDGRELREEDADPLYHGYCHDDGQSQQFEKHLYQSHGFLLTWVVGEVDYGRFHTSSKLPM